MSDNNGFARDRSGLYVPAALQRGGEQGERAFRRIAQEIKRLGFECKYALDEQERTIQVHFRPLTKRNREAMEREGAAGDPPELGIGKAYDRDTHPAEAALECIESGLEILRRITTD